MMRKVVRVAFKDSPKLYDYFTDLQLNVGDLVVVPAGSFYSVVTVKQIKDSSLRAEKFVVQKVDLKSYHDNMAELMFA